MKKLIVLLFFIPLFLTACISPPVPDIEQAIQDSDPNTIVPLSNDLTVGYFQTFLPIQASPTRGLIHAYTGTIGDGIVVGTRADLEHLERSMHRTATAYFDPNDHFFRDGLILQRAFVSNLLCPSNVESDICVNPIGLNPESGATLDFNGTSVTSGDTFATQIRPLSFVLEQNFGTIVYNEDGEPEFQLEGVAIALAMNPHHTVVDYSIGQIIPYRMSDEQILTIGRETAAELLPLLRTEYNELRDVPIIFGLFIQESGNSILPGRLASTAVGEVGSSSLRNWNEVHERHFLLENPANTAISAYSVNLNDEYIFVRESIFRQFPHTFGIVGQVHIVEEEVYRVNIEFNMHFFGYGEKLAFHQMVGQYIDYFSPQYDIRVIIRSTDEIHGTIMRPPHGDVQVSWVSW